MLSYLLTILKKIKGTKFCIFMFMTLCCHSYLCGQESVYKITFKNTEAKFEGCCYVKLCEVSGSWWCVELLLQNVVTKVSN